MVLLMLQLDGEVTCCVHLEMLLCVNGWEVNSIHEVVQVRFSICEVLRSKLSILDLWVEHLSLSASLSNFTVSLPVKDLSNEVESLLQILVESVKDNFIKVFKSEAISSFTLCTSANLVECAHLFLKDASLVFLECLVFLFLLSELSLQVIDL